VREHLPRTAGCIEAITELRVHEAAKFRPDVVLIEHGQDHQLQFGDVDVGEVGQRGGVAAWLGIYSQLSLWKARYDAV
jgi:hypothetical protein